MQNLTNWWETFTESLTSSLTSIGEYLPLFGGALLVMALGWLVARLLRAVVVRLGTAFNRALERFLSRPGTRGLRLSPKLLALTGNFAFWIAILLFAAIAARTARLDAFSTWLDRVIDYLPTLVAGGLIALAGFLLSTLVRDAVSAAVASTGSAHDQLAGLAAQSTVFVTAIVIGLDQIGIDVTFLITLVAIVLGGALLSLALAFGFGAKDFVGNLIAAHYVQRLLEPRERARVGDMEGRVLEITPTTVVLVNERGRLLVPARLFQREMTVLLSGDEDE
jgi:Mechanosensitive ion channel, conserved TM helix